MSVEHVDVLIVGAGISGIDAAYRLQEQCPTKTFAIVEARGVIGGTWDLFRFPGIRSDSDMFTLCYPFRPWTEAKLIVDGTSIREYVQATAHEYGLDRKIRFHRRVVRAAWSSENARWTVDLERAAGDEREQITCAFLMSCTGYFRYDQGHRPQFPGEERFRGELVHPQFWSEDLDHAGKRVVVIGSGATAVTMVPAIAERAAHVTMLQRSPSYIVSFPAVDPFLQLLGRVLPWRLAYRIVRWRNVKVQTAAWVLSKHWPGLVRRVIRALARRHLPKDYDVDTHFNPRYDPWDERICVVPDADLFEAIAAGRASIVTDQIETFTENGIRLVSGQELEADMIVTATGLNLQVLGGIELSVDGDPVDLPGGIVYRGSMLADVPNLAFPFGYVNQSWTLGADVACQHACRLLNYMDELGYDLVTPRSPAQLSGSRPILELSSGYVRRAEGLLPRQGSEEPWYRHQSYPRDRRSALRYPIEDSALEFGRARRAAAAATEVAA
jgi:cation diffusion facilitator CzcD-associated flavoprotein CzcO